jgi:hypothetical protein
LIYPVNRPILDSIMSDDHIAVLLEDIQDKLAGLAEAAAVTNDRVTGRLDRLEKTSDRILAIVEDIYPLKAEVVDHTDKLANHENRLQKLEMPQRA